LVTAKEIAAILGCSQKFVRRITDTGHFPKDIQIGPRMRRWRRVEVEAWLNAKEAGLG
jgi:excisionase family DNA binding protein